MDNVKEVKSRYTVVHDMLQGCVDFEYTQMHIFSDSMIRIIIAELEYWHSLSGRLLKEKAENGQYDTKSQGDREDV